MAKINVTRTIGVDSDKAWQAIRAIGGLDKWFPIITSCEVDGSGVGAIRTCGLENGVTLVESVDAIDDAARVFEYSITDSPMPARNYQGRVEVREAGPGRDRLVGRIRRRSRARRRHDRHAQGRVQRRDQGPRGRPRRRPLTASTHA